MKRFHIQLAVETLDQNIEFYSTCSSVNTRFI